LADLLKSISSSFQFPHVKAEQVPFIKIQKAPAIEVNSSWNAFASTFLISAMRLCKVSALLSLALFHLQSVKKEHRTVESFYAQAIFLSMIDCLSSLIDFGIIGICLASPPRPPLAES
jgi:hypothetical protein